MPDEYDDLKRLVVALRVKDQLQFEVLIEQGKFFLKTTGEIDDERFECLELEAEFYGFEIEGWTKKGTIFQVQLKPAQSK